MFSSILKKKNSIFSTETNYYILFLDIFIQFVYRMNFVTNNYYNLSKFKYSIFHHFYLNYFCFIFVYSF